MGAASPSFRIRLLIVFNCCERTRDLAQGLGAVPDTSCDFTCDFSLWHKVGQTLKPRTPDGKIKKNKNQLVISHGFVLTKVPIVV